MAACGSKNEAAPAPRPGGVLAYRIGMILERAPDIDAFVASPIGRLSIGATHAVWCASPTLCGTIHWGRANERAAVELARRLAFAAHPALAAGFDAISDARAVEAVEWPTFTRLSDELRPQVALLDQRVRRHAILPPSGVTGAFVAALLPALGVGYPLRVLGSASQAERWFERPGGALAHAAARELVGEIDGLAPILRRLRDHLDGALRTASIDRTAVALGVSRRTLQRELARIGTSFQAELTATRIRGACMWLVHSSEKIETIAARVGLSASQLQAAFRAVVGETPVAYRARHRPEAPRAGCAP